MNILNYISYFAIMKLSIVASIIGSAAAFTSPAAPARISTAVNNGMDDLASIAEKSNPVLKFYDPLQLSSTTIWGNTNDETIAFLRHSEIKHGRVAMAAFVGWWAVGSGLRFPGELAHGVEFSSLPSSGLEAWDAVPGWGKAQMLLFAGLIELHDEIFHSRRGTHYMKGGIPGKVCILCLCQ